MNTKHRRVVAAVHSSGRFTSCSGMSGNEDSVWIEALNGNQESPQTKYSDEFWIN